MPSALPTLVITSTVVNTAAAATVSLSVTAVPNAAYFVFELVTKASPFTDSTVSGMSLTWTRVASDITGNDYGALFVGYGTPTTGAVTITHSGTPTAGRYLIMEVQQGQSGSNPVAASQHGTGTATSGSLAITRSGLGQLMLGFWGHKTAEVTTHDTTYATWTELSDTTTTYGMETQYMFGFDQTHSASWATSSLYVGYVVQIAPFAYTGATKTDTKKPAYLYSGALPDLDDTDVWARLD